MENKKTKEKRAKKGASKKPVSRKKIMVRRILAIVLILLLIGGGVFAYKTVQNGGGLQGFLATLLGHNDQTLKDLPPIYCLVMGESTGLTDSIMLCEYNPKNQQASLLSIPRDTFVGKNTKRATSSDKINAVYQKSPETTVEKVNQLTGLDNDYYLLIDTKSLVQLVDELGGVWFDVPIDMKYDDTTQNLHIDLKAGYQLLDGNKAEQVVRFRHNNDGSSYPTEYGDQDIGRMRTQREFIASVLSQTLKPQNILKIGNFIEIAHKNVKTNVPLSVIKDYIPYAVNFSTENLKSGTLPGEPKLCNGVWLYLADETETQKVVNELFLEPTSSSEETGNTDTSSTNSTTNTTSNSNSTSSIRIELLNGSGKKNALSKVTEKLKDKGYNVVKTGNTSTTSKSSIINRTGKSSDVASKLKKTLDFGTITTGEDNAGVDFTIIIGSQYDS